MNAQEVKALLDAFAAGKCVQAPPNTPPVISAADPVSRQQGSPATEVNIAKVSDAQTAAGELKVSATAPAGISVNNIKNSGGAISAEIAALCSATAGVNLVALTVVDGNGATATANLSVSVTVNTPPRLGQYPASTVSIGGAATVSPAAAPADNGSISTASVAAEGFAGAISLNPATGVVSISNARPAGNYTVSVRATDNCGATSTATFPLVIQAGALGLASAANFAEPIAPESVVSAFGQKLSTATQTASTLPLPTTLAGTVVKIRDAAGSERGAQLFFVSPTQINYLLPKETASGVASVVVTAGDGSISAGSVEVAATAPGLFSADGSGAGLASGYVLRVKPDGSTSFEAIARFDQAQNKTVAVPIDLGAPADQVFLVLYATGIRYHRGLSSISASVGGESAPVQYAGEQGSLIGVDQINLRLTRTLAGRGDVAVAVTVENKAANRLNVNIK